MIRLTIAREALRFIPSDMIGMATSELSNIDRGICSLLFNMNDGLGSRHRPDPQ